MSDKREEPVFMEGAVCPLPLGHDEQIVMGHGSGGKMSHELIGRIFLPSFDNDVLRAANDAGVVQAAPGARLAISTDSHVVTPLFFPGGDIGRLAVCGTVNDVAVMGAEPRYLTAGFILEEGLPQQTLARVVASMQAAAAEAGVVIVAGDTKVVEKGKADGLYINTSGVGVVPAGVELGGERARPGDVVLLSGPMGDHGIAVLAARGELGFEAAVESDVAPLNRLAAAALQAGDVRVMRDPPAAASPARLTRSPASPASPSSSTRRRCPSAPPSPPPARCSASTRSTSPTKAGCWSSWAATRLTPCWRRCALPRTAQRRSSSAKCARSRRAAFCCAPRWAASVLWTCSPESCCRASVRERV